MLYESQSKGVTETLAPKRPNSIGLSIVKIIKVEENILHIEKLGILDDTLLLDIKPYVPIFDEQKGTEIGRYSKAKYDVKKLELRFK